MFKFLFFSTVIDLRMSLKGLMAAFFKLVLDFLHPGGGGPDLHSKWKTDLDRTGNKNKSDSTGDWLRIQIRIRSGSSKLMQIHAELGAQLLNNESGKGPGHSMELFLEKYAAVHCNKKVRACLERSSTTHEHV
jgi:hypothetical protein